MNYSHISGGIRINCISKSKIQDWWTAIFISVFSIIVQLCNPSMGLWLECFARRKLHSFWSCWLMGNTYCFLLISFLHEKPFVRISGNWKSVSGKTLPLSMAAESGFLRTRVRKKARETVSFFPLLFHSFSFLSLSFSGRRILRFVPNCWFPLGNYWLGEI